MIAMEEEYRVVEPVETSLTREVRFTMEAYLDAREVWKTHYDGLTREIETRLGREHPIDTNDERAMYTFAWRMVNTDALGEFAGEGTTYELRQMAWRYLTEVSRLSSALGNLKQHLENLERLGRHIEDA
jgi:hypothetical protein